MKRITAQEVIDAARVRCMELDQQMFDNLRKHPTINVEFRVVKEPKELTNGKATTD
jgi:hypothetical protein